MNIKRIFSNAGILFFLVLFTGNLHSQILDPVRWNFSKEKLEDNRYELVFTAVIHDGWSIYGFDLEPGGPVATSIEFKESDDYKFIDGLEHPSPDVKYDPNFNMDVPMFSGSVAIRQVVEVISAEPVNVRGELVYMACDDTQCLPPDYLDFSFMLKGAKDTDKIAEAPHPEPEEEKADKLDEPDKPEPEYDIDTIEEFEEEAYIEDIYYEVDDTEPEGSVWWNFILGFMGGLLALLTPCVFPMIPLTVSFFLRNAGKRSKAFRDALFYGFSIIFIYVVIGIAVSVLFGADRLNAAATSPGFNLFFFALLLFFAAAFFGAFELQLPSSWTNRLDSKADQTGGLAGVLLMGLIFVLVTFSCTGPIVGTLLVEAALSRNVLAPALGMTGFSLALAIPFTLFAIFPTALKSLPKSGGWMNAVKVVLGFIVLAFSLKFFAVADAVGQWNILSREGFIVIWIAVFILLGLYLIGVIRFAHDSKLEHLSVPRLFLAIASFAFVFYLLPGLWGAPLRTVSSFLPPMTTQSFNISQPPALTGVAQIVYEGESVYEGPHGLMAFTDYDEGMAFARKKGKPVFLDFTGFGCANCRKMEAATWADPRVSERLRNNFIKISLFVDDRTRLPEEEQFISTATGRERKIRTIGQKWRVFQAENYNINTQPYYVILDHNENMLAEPRGYNTNVEEYIEFLDTGYDNFQRITRVLNDR